MPYTSTIELPEAVRDALPEDAQELYRRTFNAVDTALTEAWRDRRDREHEATAHQAAWSAVKNEYEKDEESGKWRKKND